MTDWNELQKADARIAELEADVMILMGRLIFEDQWTLAPETQDVVNKYRPEFEVKNA